MKLLVVHPYLKTKGGAEKLIYEYVTRSKLDIDLVTLFYLPNKTFSFFKNIEVKELHNVPFVKNRLETYFGRAILVYMYGLLTKIENLKDYDAILVNHTGLGGEVAIKNNIPNKTFMYCHSPLRSAGAWYDIQWVESHRGGRGRVTRYIHPFMRHGYNILEKWAFSKYNHIFFNSELSRERALMKHLVSENASEVIYPGADIDLSKQELIPELEGKEFIVYISRYATMKRQLELVRAWKRFTNKNPHSNLHLVIAGAGFKEDYFNKVKKEAQDVNSIHILKNLSREQINWLYVNSIGGLFLAWYEDFGIVPFEVLAAGKTLIASSSGGFLELAQTAPSLILIPERFNEKIFEVYVANAIEKFWKNKNYYIDKGKRNAWFVKDLGLSWDNFARRLDSRIKELVKNDNITQI